MNGLRHFLGALGRLLDTIGDFLRCRPLLLDRRCDCGGDFADLSNRAANAFDRGDRFGGRRLNGTDLAGNVLGCFGRLIG